MLRCSVVHLTPYSEEMLLEQPPTVSRYRSLTSGGLVRTAINLRLSQIEQVDRLAKHLGQSRSLTVAQLVELGLRIKGVDGTAA